jgi:hypothetical protein
MLPSKPPLPCSPLVIEPNNTRDIPGYFLNTQAEAAGICAAVGFPKLKDADGLLPHAGDGGRYRHQAAGIRRALHRSAEETLDSPGWFKPRATTR